MKKGVPAFRPRSILARRMTRTAVALLLFGSGCASPSPGAEGAALLVGVAEVDITPPLGTRMGGYFRDRFADGLRDPLNAKAIVLAQGATKIAFVFGDLPGLPVHVSSRARERAEARTGIQASHISIAATHTHTGPYLPYGIQLAADQEPRASADTISSLVDKLVEAVEKAHSALRPSRLEAGRPIQTPPLSFQRRHHFKDGKVRTIGPVTRDLPDHEPQNIVRPAGPIDPEVDFLLVRDLEGPRASLTVFALHLNTVGNTRLGETQWSADFPHFLGRELRRTFGAEFVSLFGAGTCGDINYVDVSTPKTRTTEEIGTMLARTVLSEVPHLRPLENPTLGASRVRYPATLQRFSPEQVAQARKDLERPEALPFLKRVEATSIIALERMPEKTWPIEIQAFRLSPDVAVVALPGEIFVELGLAIKRDSPFETTFVIELANDVTPLYVPTRKAFGDSGYEVLNSRLDAGSGERMVREAGALLRGLARMRK